MSLSSPLAFAILATVVLVAMFYVANSYKELATALIQIAEEGTRQVFECRHGFRFNSISIINQSLLINVTNVSCPIAYSKFRYMDLVVTYSINSSAIVEWLRYSRLGGVGTWREVAIYGDFVNPINQTLGTGLWDPGETLVINATLSTKPNKLINLVIVTPSGQVTHYSP